MPRHATPEVTPRLQALTAAMKAAAAPHGIAAVAPPGRFLYAALLAGLATIDRTDIGPLVHGGDTAITEAFLAEIREIMVDLPAGHQHIGLLRALRNGFEGVLDGIEHLRLEAAELAEDAARAAAYNQKPGLDGSGHAPVTGSDETVSP